MSNNQYFYKIFHGNRYTFQNFMPPHFVPPPPPPPPALFVVPPPSHTPTIEAFDKACLEAFERKVPKIASKKAKSISIFEVREKLRHLLLCLNDLVNKEKALENKVDSLSDDEWKSTLEEIRQKKVCIKESLSEIKLDTLKNTLAKRTAKRQRLKRRNMERKRAKEERVKELEEKSRKIDENLQKIKDAVIKAKEEEETKVQADIVLKEVLRKKHNAKKCINKLDSLKKLRKARMNTAKGRGEIVSDKEAEEFDGKIDKLTLLWAKKLKSYEKEEEDLRAKLKQDKDVLEAAKEDEIEKQLTFNLKKWRKALFGDSSGTPQVNFNGDIGRFVAVRCQWDQYLNDAGTPLPVGWVVKSEAP